MHILSAPPAPAIPGFSAGFHLLPPSIASMEFTGNSAFEAASRACRFLANAGFSVGNIQARQPRGLLFGEYRIQKWRNLSMGDRRALHGALVGDMRNGPVRALLFPNAPEAAQAAFASMLREAA